MAAVSFVARTDVGRKRKANEDFFAVDEARQIFVVADGLGGHAAGRTASETASFRFCQAMREMGDLAPLEAVRRAFHDAHAAVLERSLNEPELAGMGTTLVTLWVRERTVVLAHAGDSRIYLVRGEAIYPLTHDHSLVSELVFRGKLTPEGARTHSHRHFITRALGVGESAEPDASELAVEPGDVFVLCSDGVTTPVPEDEIRDQLSDAKGDLAQAADALIELANERGGDDNATVLMVAIQ